METTAPKTPKKRSTETTVTKLAQLLVILAAALIYILYAKAHYMKSAWDEFAVSFATLALFTLAVVAAMPKLVSTLFGRSEKVYGPPKNKWTVFLLICLGALVLHVITGAVGTAIYHHLKPNAGGGDLYKLWRESWLKSNTDARHYMNIAENWYVNEGDDRLLIVFFPMLPVLIRAFNNVFHDSFISGQVINLIATVLSAGIAYFALIPAVGDKKARYGAFIALLLPGMIFMNSPMSEPLFLLFTFSALLCIEKRRFIPAGILTACAGFTRSLGVLLAVPLAIEGICYTVSLARAKKNWKKELAIVLIALALSTLGTLGYLYINYSVTGDCLKFFEYQKSNWYQSFCPFFDTVRYISRYLQSTIRENNTHMMTLWITSLIMIFGSLIYIIKQRKKLSSAFTFFYLAYFVVACGCTWLLSAVRYLSALLPLTAAIALDLNKKWQAAVCFIVLAVMYLGYTLLYMLRWSVY